MVEGRVRACEALFEKRLGLRDRGWRLRLAVNIHTYKRGQWNAKSRHTPLIESEAVVMLSDSIT